MSAENKNGWSTISVIFVVVVAIVVGLVIGWFAHGFMMTMMSRGGMGGMMNRKSGGESGHSMMSMMDGKHCSGMMRSMMDQMGAMSGMSDTMMERMDGMMKRMNSEEMRQHCRSMRASMKAMMSGSSKKDRSEGDLPAELQSLDESNTKWVQSIRGSIEPEDARGKNQVTVKVGAGKNGLQFKPAVLKINPGTTVRFEWTGKGGSHNVSIPEFDRTSPLQYQEQARFEVTFDESGMFRYFCTPHKVVGMKGLVLVE